MASFVLSLGLTPLFRKIALRTNFVDSPTGQLKKHTAPVPYMGGLAVYFSFLMTLMGVWALDPPADASKMGALLAGGTIVALLGLVDDLFSLTPTVKFLIQALAAVVLVLFGVKIKFILDPVADWAFTLLWVVGVTNALNLIDIMDGLAGGVALLAAIGFVLVPLGGTTGSLSLAAAVLGGSCLGFLPYNYQPARIYLGDSGALFIGFTLAGIAMGESYAQTNVAGISAPLLILGIPLYDTILVMFLRFMKGKSMFQGSPDHLALRLRKLGWSVKQVTGFLWAVTALLCLGAAYLVRANEKRAFVFMLGLFFLTTIFTVFISMIQVDNEKLGEWLIRKVSKHSAKAPRSRPSKRL